VPEGNAKGTLRIHASRAGSAAELADFLVDLDSAYVALYSFDLWSAEPIGGRFVRTLDLGRRYDPIGIDWIRPKLLAPNEVVPDRRLTVASVHIGSPGFWEFLGAANPLEQLRKFLSDRHERRKDREYREGAERERLSLENELLQRQVWDSENEVLRDRIAILRELGLTQEELRQLAWTAVGTPLAELGKHQDSGLIGPAE
jgi:hypothetical protein